MFGRQGQATPSNFLMAVSAQTGYMQASNLQASVCMPGSTIHSKDAKLQAVAHKTYWTDQQHINTLIAV
jgi:hypothetical protein